MSRGGKRAGSGRKQGTANTRTREIADKAVAKGITPLEYMLEVLRDKTELPERRAWAAGAAAPFIHSKMPVALVPAKPFGDDGKTKIGHDDREILDLYLGGVHEDADRD